MREKRMVIKKAQVAIFIIIALAIVGVLAIAFFPQIKKLIIPPSPSEMIPRECVQGYVEKALNTTLARGGSFAPELYIKYSNDTVEYLCYTSEWYKTCVMQKPLLKQHIEAEVNKALQTNVTKCISDMQRKLERKGYSVKTIGEKSAKIEIIKDTIIVSFNFSMQIEKGEEKLVLNPNNFRMEFDSKAYDLIMIVSSILNWEARFGDSRQETWMEFYPDIKVEKYKQSDGSKVYIVTDRASGLMIRFATRSLAWPPGLYIPI